jgi:hypothetical protein
MRPPMRAFSISALLAVALGGCASDVLPRTEKAAASPFATYDIARTAFSLVKEQETSVADLRRWGIDPASTPNLSILNYIGLMRYFLPTDAIRRSSLPPGVQICLAAQTGCEGWLLKFEVTETQRTGSVALDVTGIQRTTETSGWQAEMLLLVVDQVVVFKLWNGTAQIEERLRETNPLGPAQDLSGTARDAIDSAIPRP